MVERAVADYERELVQRLRRTLADELVGVYAGGSLALGDYEHGRSDVDLAAVVRGPLDRGRKDAIVAAVRHEALPCLRRAAVRAAEHDLDRDLVEAALAARASGASLDPHRVRAFLAAVEERLAYASG